MATLEIRKKSLKTWLHVPSDADNFILSKFYCKTDAGTFKIVEESGSNRREYSYTDITVYDDTDMGTPETFASAQALMLRLEALKYTGFNRDGDIPTSYIESVVAGTNVTIDDTDPLNPIISSTGGGGSQDLQGVTDNGNTTTNDIIFDTGVGIILDNGSKLKEGTIDAGYGGSKGVAQICAVGYELKWEAGRLYVMGDGGTTIREVSHNFTTTPTIYDDITKGFVIGSRWLLDDGTLYICTDATDDSAVWELQLINLQYVTNNGNSTTNSLNVQLDDEYTNVYTSNVYTANDANNSYAFIDNNGTIAVNSGDFEGTIQANNLTANNVNLEFPQKTAGSYTIATTDDLTGGTVTSVGLTMPSAFSVTNSPITSSGDIAVTGAGVASQYVRGDGTLANFLTTSGGGASVSYYLNGSVSQGTFGGIAMREINKVPIIGTGTDFTINANGYIQSFITDANDPNQLEIPAGNWNFETYFSASSSGGNPSFYVELYKWNGSTLSLIASSSTNPEIITGGTAIDLYLTALAVPQTTLALTDRLVIRIYVTPSGRTIKLHTEDNHLSQIITTFSTGLTALNGLTDQVQYFATGTTGTDFGISSATDTHTFNLPTASATNRGALSSTDWSAFNGKQDLLVSGSNIKTINGNSVLGSGNLLTGAPLTRQEFNFSGAQTFTLSGIPSDIYAVFVDGQELNSSQYSFSGTTLTIADTLESGDKINILYTPTSVGVLEYYTKAQIDGFNYKVNSVEFIEVNSLTDLPASSGGVITLVGGYTYLFLKHIDLLGARLVCGADTVIVGWSSENCSIKSTGLSASTALVTSVHSLPIRNISFTHDLVFDLNGDATTTALDWFGVNLLNCASGGTIRNYTNFVAGDSALLNSGGFSFDGTIGTVAFSNTLFDLASGRTAITILPTCNITRRVRIIYSSFVVLSGETGLNFSTSATIADERYILDTVNFSGGGTYLTGVDATSNKALFNGCIGISNTSTRGFMHMINNGTDTTIGTTNVNVWVKASGVTTANTNNSKFTHASNRLTYSGAFSTAFQVTIHANVRSATNGQLISIGVAKNGTILAESEMTIRTDVINQEYPGSTCCQLDLTTNDFVELFVRNSQSPNIRVSDFNLSINKIPT